MREQPSRFSPHLGIRFSRSKGELVSSPAGDTPYQVQGEQVAGTKRVRTKPVVNVSTSKQRRSDNPRLYEGPRWSAITALVISGVVAIALLAASVYLLKYLGNDSPEASLSLVFVAAAVVLILVVCTLAIVLRRLGLTDCNEAMGLPSGSIRAIIALLLIMLFFIAAIFLFNSTQNKRISNETRPFQGITAERFATIPLDQIQSSVTRVEGETTVYDVVLYPPSSGTQTSDDIAKQLITTIGTLVVAVAAFYFGANSVQAARKLGTDGVLPASDDHTPDHPLGGAGETQQEETKTTTETTPVTPVVVADQPDGTAETTEETKDEVLSKRDDRAQPPAQQQRNDPDEKV